MKPNTPEWEKLANREARAYCPPIYPCAKCTYPVISGYCCNSCGSTNPSSREPDEKITAKGGS